MSGLNVSDRLSTQNIVSAARLEVQTSTLPLKNLPGPSVRKSLGHPFKVKKGFALGDGVSNEKQESTLFKSINST